MLGFFFTSLILVSWVHSISMKANRWDHWCCLILEDLMPIMSKSESPRRGLTYYSRRKSQAWDSKPAACSAAALAQSLWLWVSPDLSPPVCSLGTNIFHGQSWLGPTISIQTICHIYLVICFVEGKSRAKSFSFKSDFLTYYIKFNSQINPLSWALQRELPV